MIRQRASPVSRTATAIASRIAWSSALRFEGLEIVSRRTPGAGSSMCSSPGIGGRHGSELPAGEPARTRRGALVVEPVGAVGLGLLVDGDLGAGLDLRRALQRVAAEDDADVAAARRGPGPRHELEVAADPAGL